MDSITREEKDLLHKLFKEDKFFCQFLSGKEKFAFWTYKLLKNKNEIMEASGLLFWFFVKCWGNPIRLDFMSTTLKNAVLF